MSLSVTTKNMKDLLINITADLEKADGGNKAASQRVRTGTVKLEKIAKAYRKESIATEKKTKGQGRAKAAGKAKKAAKPAAKKPVQPAKKVQAKAKPKAKAASFRPRQLSIKRGSASRKQRSFR